MNYQKIYDNIIFYRQKNVLIRDWINRPGEVERHHIVPKCLGGLNEKSNIINVTPREHYILHLLLGKIYEGTIHEESMKIAVTKMRSIAPRHNRSFKFNSRLFEKIRKDAAVLTSKRTSKLYFHNGEYHSIREWSSILGLSEKIIRRRIELGWSNEDLFKPKIEKIYYEINGKKYILNEIAEHYSIPFSTLYSRVVKNKIPIEEAIKYKNRIDSQRKI